MLLWIERAGIPLNSSDDGMVIWPVKGSVLRDLQGQFGPERECDLLQFIIQNPCPGLENRVGWRQDAITLQVLQARMAGDWAGAPLLMRLPRAIILASGDHDRHLRRLKFRISEVQAVIARVKASFPQALRVTVPTAGFFVVDRTPASLAEFYWRYTVARAGVHWCRSTGLLFSRGPSFQELLRLNCANEPSSTLLQCS